jgi:CHAD domain-containing protein
MIQLGELAHWEMGSTTFVLQPGDGWSPELVRPALGRALAVEEEARHSLRVSHLDSFDWRLLSGGVRLALEQVGRRRALVLTDDDGTQLTVPVGRRTPRFAADLPSQLLRDRLGKILEVRALLVIGECRVERQRFHIRDRGGNTVLRMMLERQVATDAAGSTVGAPVVTLRVEGLTGHDTIEAKVLATLEAGARPGAFDPIALAAAARGRQPGDYSSRPTFDLKPRYPAGEAAADILEHLLEVMIRNVDGVIEDIDIEFLHDLRVAIRRTRSVLGQLKMVFDRAALGDLPDRFKSLGGPTGELRDLDVYLEEMDVYRSLLPAPAASALTPLDALLRDKRRRARRRVVRTLRSSDFASLTDDWRGFLDGLRVHGGPAAQRPIGELADERILAAFERVVRRGRALDPGSPTEALHRLRIDAKKLRYLIELFSSLYPLEDSAGLVKQLKGLQDVLGGFNDMVVQQRRLGELAGELAATGEVPVQTLMAMGRLQSILEHREQELRASFTERFETFMKVKAEVRALCGRGRRTR